MIVIENLSKKVNKKNILDDISFNVDGGEFVSIIGSSGAGKSTLIHALIGAEKINNGSIQVDTYYVNKLSSKKIQEYRRKIGIIFQDFKLLDKKTVFENVAFALEVCGYSSKFIQKRTIDVLRIVGLEEHRNHFPKQLSGGEQQRTAIARALVHAPDLLFADEPSGNLDPENTASLAKLLLKINKSGTTIILATHDRDIVNFVKKRVIKLENGRLISDKKKAVYH